ncbi:MAG: DUF2244 domain-containing protein [Rhizobiaceae bacterium]|nr:DUF2244 domain-containing protein [Rhizobiaceae bacterium]
MSSDTKHPELDASTPDFVAELTPYRSLGRMGFLWLMAFIAFTCFISGLLFLVMGAWPVFLFMGLDVLVIYAAFKFNYRSARAKERVSVGRNELKIEKFHPSGRVSEHVFNPFWTRFEVNRHEEYGILSMRLNSRGEELDIGSFLNPDDRESFAFAFSAALNRVKT